MIFRRCDVIYESGRARTTDVRSLLTVTSTTYSPFSTLSVLLTMANVVHPAIDFHHGPAAPNLGFGFGMSNASARTGWQQHVLSPKHTNPAAFQQLASSISQSSPNRAQKRRHEPEDDGDFGGSGRHGLSHATNTGLRDDAMDRSPTPERPKRAAPKRARVINVVEPDKGEKSKENKPPGSDEDADMDVGVLLGEFIEALLV